MYTLCRAIEMGPGQQEGGKKAAGGVEHLSEGMTTMTSQLGMEGSEDGGGMGQCKGFRTNCRARGAKSLRKLGALDLLRCGVLPGCSF